MGEDESACDPRGVCDISCCHCRRRRPFGRHRRWVFKNDVSVSLASRYWQHPRQQRCTGQYHTVAVQTRQVVSAAVCAAILRTCSTVASHIPGSPFCRTRRGWRFVLVQEAVNLAVILIARMSAFGFLAFFYLPVDCLSLFLTWG